MFLRKKKKNQQKTKQQKKVKVEENTWKINSVTPLPGGSEKYITEVLAFQCIC